MISKSMPVMDLFVFLQPVKHRESVIIPVLVIKPNFTNTWIDVL